MLKANQIDRQTSISTFTLWLFNIAMENGPFIDGLPIKNGDFPWFSMAMLNNQMVSVFFSELPSHHAMLQTAKWSVTPPLDDDTPVGGITSHLLPI